MNISPTPWVRGDFNSIRDSDRNVVAFLAGDTIDPLRVAANMRLVVMAPRLLAAMRKARGDCRVILADLDGHPDDFAVKLLATEMQNLLGELTTLIKEVEA